MNLKDLVIDTRAVEVAFPGHEDFKVRLQYISRPMSKKLVEAAEVQEFKAGRLVNIKRDEEKFSNAFVEHCIIGWSGLTIDILSHLVLIDAGDMDPNTIVPYSQDNAAMLLKESVGFNQFIDDTVFNLEIFRIPK